jgi:hypothetical protein
MLELVSYGLTGLAAMVIMVSCLAYSDEFSLRGERSINLTDRALSQRSRERSTGAIYRGVPSRTVLGVTLHG